MSCVPLFLFFFFCAKVESIKEQEEYKFRPGGSTMATPALAAGLFAAKICYFFIL